MRNVRIKRCKLGFEIIRKRSKILYMNETDTVFSCCSVSLARNLQRVTSALTVKKMGTGLSRMVGGEEKNIVLKLFYVELKCRCHYLNLKRANAGIFRAAAFLL